MHPIASGRIARPLVLLLMGIAVAHLLTMWSVTAGAQQNISTNIADYVAHKLNDVTANMRVTFYDDQAGRKMGEGFEVMHKLKGDVLMRYKEENKLRLDARAPRAIYIMNNTTQQVFIPSLGIRTTMNFADSPGKRKTLLDVGLISQGYLAYTQAEFRGVRPVNGVNCAVFRISYRNKELDTSHRLVWIDPKTKVTLKREEYSQEGKLNGTFYYRNPVEVAPGIWFPSAIEVINNEGQRAGVTVYRNVKVNQGLDDSLFRL
ncbi:MAG: outer membrane lipoprotein-sorting protein [Chloroherpetonaceae bacterium]|nr:outer membrane lipoprotein-sorting protein [Chthonomonadaceae bacterium]MDW8208103.1 outer membrane lipoprotein-sorting protein [Chloroherpetonaceae bacterium]